MRSTGGEIRDSRSWIWFCNEDGRLGRADNRKTVRDRLFLRGCDQHDHRGMRVGNSSPTITAITITGRRRQRGDHAEPRGKRWRGGYRQAERALAGRGAREAIVGYPWDGSLSRARRERAFALLRKIMPDDGRTGKGPDSDTVKWPLWIGFGGGVVARGLVGVEKRP